MDCKQKRMGIVGCFGQIENIKRQSLIYEFYIWFLFAVQRYGIIANTIFATKVRITTDTSKYNTNIVFVIFIFLCTSKTQKRNKTT